MQPPPLVILGCGFLGTEVVRQVAGSRERVTASVRSSEHAETLRALDVDARAVSVLTRELATELIAPGSDVLIGFPPDGMTDRSIAPALVAARAVAYVSTTGVYGDARGRVDERTPLDLREARAALRAEAEDIYTAIGATVLRAAGIYGPGRGLHRRLASGEFRIPGDGTNVVSRIHVADLARIALGVLEKFPRGEGTAFVVADDAPVPQIEVIRWLCSRLGLAIPTEARIGEVAPTLRHDRAVDNRRVKAALGLSLHYPSYKEGFAHCLAAEP